MRSKGQTVIVSSRLPWKEETDRSKPSCERRHYIGITQTLDSVLRINGGTWIGCSHSRERETVTETGQNRNETPEYVIAPVFLATGEKTDHQRFSNEVIWPLFHGFASPRSSSADSWIGYCKVNGQFAEEVQNVAGHDDFVWVHDYPLMMVAGLLRSNGWQQSIGYFHHIPFPHPALFQTMPWGVELLNGLLEFDLIGFQRDDDRRNFVACLQEFLPLSLPVEIDNKFVLHALDRKIKAGTYPVGIDFQEFSREASRASILAAAKGIMTAVRSTRIVLGVGQLEPTAGIVESLSAFHRLLKDGTEQRGRVTMIQIAVPCNERVSNCRELELQIETIVARINERFGTSDWIPVHYYHRQLTLAQMIAFYRAADVALIAPLRDGISLAAKEFCACRRDEQGVLILSEFSGASEELRAGALHVNPHDTEDVSKALQAALRMSASEQRERMAVLRSLIRINDVFNWQSTFQSDAAIFSPPPRSRWLREAGVRERFPV
jgi:trehalose 6-phosphate synthase